MTLEELLEEYERRKAEAARHGASAPLAKVYSVVLRELRAVDGTEGCPRLVGTGEAAEILGVSPKTVRRWLVDDRFPGATKTSDEGEWRIPVGDIHGAAGRDPESGSPPRLWSPADG